MQRRHYDVCCLCMLYCLLLRAVGVDVVRIFRFFVGMRLFVDVRIVRITAFVRGAVC